MKQTIEIEVPEGKKAVYDDKNQCLKFVDAGPVRSKSWEEFCINNPVAKDEYVVDSIGSFIHKFSNINRGNRQTFLKTEEDAEGILALIQLTRLHDEWVGDWKPDYVHYHSAIKYQKDGIIITDYLVTSNLLAFPSKEMAEEFLSCFEGLILDARRFI